MSIKTKLRVNALITIGLAVVVGIAVFISSVNVEQAERSDHLADRVIKDVSELNSLSYAYLLLKNERPKVQWRLKHVSLGKILSEHVAGSREEEVLLTRLRANHEQMKRLFEAVSEGVEKIRPGMETGRSSYDELNEGLTAQLMARAETMVNDASLLVRESSRHMDAARRTSLIFILASAFALIISAVTTSSLLVRSIGGSIRVLEQGTQRIASGDLAYRVSVGGDDELSRLAAAFNEMTGKLERSHAVLEQEVLVRTRAEEEMRKYAAQLEISNRELQDFAFVASHDLQEPLRKIQSFGDQLRVEYGDRLYGEGKDYLERMQKAALRMQDLIRALLSYSRLTTKAAPFSAVDLAAVARDVVGDLEARIRDVNGQVEIGALPAIEAEPTQMRQLLQNLIGNALKFHGDGKPMVRVYGREVPTDGTSADRSGDGRYQILVEDNGIGFDEKYLDRIFSPFQRLHGRGEYEGTGMGLAICRKIVERHGGTITAKSVAGKGATFVVMLPTKQPDGGTT